MNISSPSSYNKSDEILLHFRPHDTQHNGTQHNDTEGNNK